jgi:hypothetical protein
MVHQRLLFACCCSIIFILGLWIFPHGDTELINSTLDHALSCNTSTPLLPAMKPINAAIVILADNRTNRLRSTCDGLQALQKNLLHRFPYPILLFHDLTLKANQKQFLRNCSTTPARFIEINMSPEPFSFDDSVKPLINCSTCTWGYLKMIHFFFVDIFIHPAVRDLDYFLRLDTDSAILSPITYDPFEFMRSNKKYYGFRQRGLTPKLVSQKIWPCVNSFLLTQKVKTKKNG